MTTRFWTFEGCVQTLFRWQVFQLPAAEVLKTSVKKQRETNYKRIVRVRAFWHAGDALRAGGCVSVPPFDRRGNLNHGPEEPHHGPWRDRQRAPDPIDGEAGAGRT